MQADTKFFLMKLNNFLINLNIIPSTETSFDTNICSHLINSSSKYKPETYNLIHNYKMHFLLR